MKNIRGMYKILSKHLKGAALGSHMLTWENNIKTDLNKENIRMKIGFIWFWTAPGS
jgi:hypothetical protein